MNTRRFNIIFMTFIFCFSATRAMQNTNQIHHNNSPETAANNKSQDFSVNLIVQIDQLLREYKQEQATQPTNDTLTNEIPSNNEPSLALDYDDKEIRALIDEPESITNTVSDGKVTLIGSFNAKTLTDFMPQIHCPYCYKNYTKRNFLDKHIKTCQENPAISQKNQQTASANNQNKKDEHVNTTNCPLCKKNIIKCYTKRHNNGMEHKINLFYGKNTLKKELKKTLICNFPNCNKSFNDIDDFADHMIAEHCNNKGCLFPMCHNKETRTRKEHFIYHHTLPQDNFFICPGCKQYETKSVHYLLNAHMPNCAQCTELLEKIKNHT